MRTILALLFISLFANAYAFEFRKKHREKKPPLWDTLYFKNEISLDVSLPFSYFMGARPDNAVLGASYLRALTKRNFLRVSTRHSFENFSETRGNLDDYDYVQPGFYLRDSVITNTSKIYRYYSPDIRFGYEHRFGKRRVKAILGVDAFLGVEVEKTYNEYRYFKPGQVTDSLGNPQLIISEIERGPRYTESRAINLKVGIAPFVGMFAHLSKRFSVRAVMMYDLYWSHNLSFSSTSSDTFQPSGGLNMRFDGMLAEVGVNVHF